MSAARARGRQRGHPSYHTLRVCALAHARDDFVEHPRIARGIWGVVILVAASAARRAR